MKLLNALFVLSVFFIFFLIIRNIRSIIKSSEKGEVFSLVNAKKLKNISFLLLFNLVSSTSVLLFNSTSVHSFEAGAISAVIGMLFGQSLGLIVAVVFTFFIAALFKVGVNIQEENQSFV